MIRKQRLLYMGGFVLLILLFTGDLFWKFQKSSTILSTQHRITNKNQHHLLFDCLSQLMATPFSQNHDHQSLLRGCWHLTSDFEELMHLQRLNFPRHCSGYNGVERTCSSHSMNEMEVRRLMRLCPSFTHRDSYNVSAAARNQTQWRRLSDGETFDQHAKQESMLVADQMFSQLEARAVLLYQLHFLCTFLTAEKLEWFLNYGALISFIRQHDLNPWNDDIDLMVEERAAPALRRLSESELMRNNSLMFINVDGNPSRWVHLRLLDRRTGVFTEIWLYRNDTYMNESYVVTSSYETPLAEGLRNCSSGQCRVVYPRDWVYPLQHVHWHAEPELIWIPHQPRTILLLHDDPTTDTALKHKDCCGQVQYENLDWPHTVWGETFYICEWMRTQAMKKEARRRAASSFTQLVTTGLD